jgi:hypothetical protein
MRLSAAILAISIAAIPQLVRAADPYPPVGTQGETLMIDGVTCVDGTVTVPANTDMTIAFFRSGLDSYYEPRLDSMQLWGVSAKGYDTQLEWVYLNTGTNYPPPVSAQGLLSGQVSLRSPVSNAGGPHRIYWIGTNGPVLQECQINVQ